MTQTGPRLKQLFIEMPRIGTVCAVFCTTAALVVFLLPFAVPVPFHQTISASYMAGFNNRAAAMSAAFISALAALWNWQRHKQRSYAIAVRLVDDGPITFWAITGVVLCTVFFTALAGIAIHKSGERYIADAGYFIEQMSKHAQYGGKLYNQLEFAYGPLLFYPTVFLQKVIRCSTAAAYFFTLACEQAIGLFELTYILNVLPTSQRLRTFAFALFAFGSLNPLLGLNYTLYRFLTPLALLLLVRNRNSVIIKALMLGAGEAVSFGISAELGFAFAIGAGALLLVNERTDWRHWFVPACAVGAGAILFAASAGRAYFHMLRAFAVGGLNLPVAPYPHLLVFLFAVTWLAPFALGSVLANRREHTASVLTCYAFGLALLPSALGRCDPLHVFFVGMSFSLLSLVGVVTAPKPLRTLWCICLCVLVFWQVGVTNKLFRFRTADTLSAVLPASVSTRLAGLFGPDSNLGQHLQPGDEPFYKLDVNRLEVRVGSGKVATPFEVPITIERALRESNHFQSSYFAYMVDTFNAPAEQRAIQDLDSSQWALIPNNYSRPFIEQPSNLRDLQGFAFPLPTRHEIPFVAGSAMALNLAEHWAKVDEFGPYLLLERKAGPGAYSLSP